MKILLYLLPLTLLGDTCKVVILDKSRIHPTTHQEIKKEIENTLLIIEKCQMYQDVAREAELYNEYLLFKYLKLPTVIVKNDDLIERCRRIDQQIYK